MPRLSERGFAHLLLLFLLGAGLVATVYLVTSGNPLKLFSKATVSQPVGPEVSFSLVGPSPCSGLMCLLPGNPQPQEEFSVKLYARSDIETANLFTARINFPKDVVEVKEIQTAGSFIQNWVEEYYDNETGYISLSGGVPAPGYQTQTGGESSLMATIVLKAKTIGTGPMNFSDSSSIYSNLNNIDILTIKRGYDISVEVPPPSPAPTSAPVANFGQAVNFAANENANNAYVTISPNITLSNTINPPFTFEAWINTPQPSSGNYLRVYSVATLTKLQAPGDYGYIAKLKLETQEGNGTSRPMFSVLTGNGGNSNIHLSYTTVGSNGSQALEPNRWYHIAGTISSEGNTCVAKLYVNGILSDTAERYSAGGCAIRMPNVQNLLLAKPEAGAGGISGYYYPGLIDELRVSNTLRYTGNFTTPSVPFTLDPNTILLYRFNGSLYDSTYSRDGQPSGNVQFVNSTIGFPQPSVSPSATPTPTPTTRGDGNGDGVINLVDMSILHSSFPPPTGSGNPNYRVSVDMNDDGKINTLDFLAHRGLLIQLGVIRVRPSS